MTYQFEYGEIKYCSECPINDFANDKCELSGKYTKYSSTPKENNCPLVDISKTETTTPTTLSDKVKKMAHCAIDAGIIDAVDWSAEIIRRLEETP